MHANIIDKSFSHTHTYAHAVLPEGKERVYVVALAVESVLLIAAVLAVIFLLVLYCKNRKVRVTCTPKSLV